MEGPNTQTDVHTTSPPTSPHSSRQSTSPTSPSSPQPLTSPNLSTSPTSPATEGANTMPARNPRGNAGRPVTPKREADLSSLLTAPQKNELVVLVTKITDTMQQQIAHIFDSLPIKPGTPAPAAATTDTSIMGKRKSWHLTPAIFDLKNIGFGKTEISKENTKPGGPSTQGSAGGSKQSLDDKARAVLEKEEKEALNTSQAELKKEALIYFKKWQASLVKRVGEISVAKENATQPSSSKPGAGRPSGGARSSSKAPPASAPKGNTAAVETKQEAGAITSVMEADAALIQLYPPTGTPLCSLPLETRKLLLHSMLLLLLSLEHYTAYSRVLLLHIASSLHIPLHVLTEDEVRVAKSLSQATKELSADESAQKRSEENKSSRRWKVGLASAAGAALIGVTGGLAAPLVAAGIGSVLGGIGLGGTVAAGLLGTMAESGLVVGTLFGLYGARGAGKMMESYAKDIQDFAFLPLHGSLATEFREAKEVPPDDRRLRLVIAISGWLTQKGDIVQPWRALGHQAEVYALRWELEALMKMGNSLETVVKSTAWSVAKKEIIARTIFASLLEALWPLSLLKISKIVDNPWSVGMVRADKAGIVLADAIINKVQGERGVTLIGYSLGARVIYTCLMSLAERRAFGLVENVVLMGTPAPSDGRVWSALRSVVAGRVVNVFSENDYILAFLYRTSSIQFGVAGLQRIENASGVENVNATDRVSGHLRYQYLVGSILRDLGWEDIDLQRVAEDEETLALVEEKLEQDSRRRQDVDMDNEAAELEKEVNQKNEQDNLTRHTEKLKIVK